MTEASTESSTHNPAIPLTFSATRTPLAMASTPSPSSVTTSKSLTPSNENNFSDMVSFFRQRSAHLSSPIFRLPSKQYRDLTSPVFRINPLAGTVAAAASLPPTIPPILVADLQFSLVSAFNGRPFTVDLGSRAACVPLPYAIRLSLNDLHGTLRPISVRLERILDPRPTLFVGVISGNIDLSSNPGLKGGPKSLRSALVENVLTFWAAPDTFEPNGFSRLLLTVTDHDYNDYEVFIDIKAAPVSPNISVEAPGYPRRQVRTETNLAFKEHEKESDVLITVWNETENKSPLLVNVVVEESCGGTFSIGKSYRDSEKCVPLLIDGGNSCTFYARFEMKPEMTVRKCYYGSVLIKYAVALPGEGLPGQDQELHQFYDHVLNLRADGGGISHEEQRSLDWNNCDTSRRILDDDDCVCSDVEEHGERACILFDDHGSPGVDLAQVHATAFVPVLNSNDPPQMYKAPTPPEQVAFQKCCLPHSDISKLDPLEEAQVSRTSATTSVVNSESVHHSLITSDSEIRPSGPNAIVHHGRGEHADDTSVHSVPVTVDREELREIGKVTEANTDTDLLRPAEPEILTNVEGALSSNMPVSVDTTVEVNGHVKTSSERIQHNDILIGPQVLPISSEREVEPDPQDNIQTGNPSAYAPEIQSSVDSIPPNPLIPKEITEVNIADFDGAGIVGEVSNSSIIPSGNEDKPLWDADIPFQEGPIQLGVLNDENSDAKPSTKNLSFEAIDSSPHNSLIEKQMATVQGSMWNGEWTFGNSVTTQEPSAENPLDFTGKVSNVDESGGFGVCNDDTAEHRFETRSEAPAMKRPKLKMTRRIRDNGIVMEANSGTVEFPLQNASSEVVEVSIFMERHSRDGSRECSVNVTPSYVVIAAQGKAILTMTRLSPLGGEHNILLRGSTLGPQQSKRTYRIPVHVKPSSVQLESNEEFSVDRPTMSFYNPESEGRHWNIRIRNGTRHSAGYTAWIGQGCGELMNSDGNPAFRIVGSADGLIEPQRFANVQVEFVGGNSRQHFHGRLYFNVGKQQDFIPLFGYVGGSNLRLMTNELGYVIVRNVGERAGFIVITGPECDPVRNQSVRAVLAPNEEREFVAPYGTGSVVYTGDEIARTRACRAEEIERTRTDKAFDSSSCDMNDNIFEGEFDGEDAAVQAEMLDWSAEDRFSMFYSGRLFDYTVHRYMFDLNNEEKVDFVETSRAGRNGWSVAAKDGFVHIENLNVAKELSFEAIGAEPCRGVIAAFGDALLAPFREVVEVTAQGKTQTVAVKLQGPE